MSDKPRKRIYNRSISSEEIKEELKQWSRASILSPTWKTILFCVGAGFFVSAILLWTTASSKLIADIQTFNGALTIPVGALTWAFSFTFVFLVPMKYMQILMAKTMLYSIEGQEELMDRVTHELLNPMKKGEHAVLDRFEKMFRDEMALLREEIREEKLTVDDALEEGERQAAEVLADGMVVCDICKEQVETDVLGFHREAHAHDWSPPSP